MAHNPTAKAARSAALASLQVAGNMSEAARAAGVDRGTLYEWRQADKAFDEACKRACEVAWDRAEREAYRRAVEGWEEPVYQGGVQVGVTRRYSDTMLQSVLRAKRAKEWRESMKHEHSGPDGGPMLVDFGALFPSGPPPTWKGERDDGARDADAAKDP